MENRNSKKDSIGNCLLTRLELESLIQKTSSVPSHDPSHALSDVQMLITKTNLLLDNMEKRLTRLENNLSKPKKNRSLWLYRMIPCSILVFLVFFFVLSRRRRLMRYK